MNISKKVGAMIKIVRMSQGKSQKYLADKLGLTKPSIVAIEQGRQNINVQQLYNISQALNSGILDFFAFEAIKDWKGKEDELKKRVKVGSLEAQLKSLRKI